MVRSVIRVKLMLVRLVAQVAWLVAPVQVLLVQLQKAIEKDASSGYDRCLNERTWMDE